MRIYIINANWGRGGPGGIAADLYSVFEKAGHSCRFAYAREAAPAGVNTFRFSGKAEVYIHALSARLFDNAGFMSHLATKKLIDDIQKFSPDVISIHNPLGYTIHVKMLMDFIRERGIPTCWTLHDCWLFTGHCTTNICPRLEEGCGRCPERREFPASWFVDRSGVNLKNKAKWFSGIKNLYFVAPSQWIADLAQNSYLRGNSTTVIQNGIDLTAFSPRESRLRERFHLEGKYVVLTVAGVWSKRKGAGYFYRLAEQMDNRYTFVMIGRNADKALRDHPNILHIPFTESREELAQWYTLADVFVNPTMGDNFPTVNLEALACGTPVITFDTGGSGEAVGACGEVVPRSDVSAMKRAVENCVSKRIPQEMCVEQAGKYDRDKRYGDYITLYQKILK